GQGQEGPPGRAGDSGVSNHRDDLILINKGERRVTGPSRADPGGEGQSSGELGGMSAIGDTRRRVGAPSVVLIKSDFNDFAKNTDPRRADGFAMIAHPRTEARRSSTVEGSRLV